MPPIEHYLYLAALLFSVGLMIIIIKRNAIMVLMGIELMLNAANLNLVAFGKINPNFYQGQFFALFIIVVAVSEAAVGLALVLRMYKYYQTSDPHTLTDLKEN
jgi:NADH-quinone oxidoreductase subunit K